MRPVPIVLTLLGLGVAGFGWKHFTSPKPVGKTEYTIAVAKKGDIKKTVSATGTLEAWTTVDVKSKAGGRIDILAVDVGSIVKKGQVIARIDPTDSLLTYNQAKASVDSAVAKHTQSGQTYRMTVSQANISVQQARANLESAKASLAEARAKLQTASTESEAQPTLTAAAIAEAKANYGVAVQAEAKLRATQPQDRASAQAAYDQALANDKNAQVSLARQKALLAKGFVSQSAVDSAAASAAVTVATVASAKSKLDTLDAQQAAERESAHASAQQALAAYQTAQANGYIVSTKRDSLAENRAAVQQAQAAVDTAKAQLDDAIAAKENGPIKQLDISSASANVASAQAQFANAKTTLDQTVVTAPTDGVVLVKSVEQGTIITSGLSLNSTGTSIVTLGDVSRKYVDVAVDETDIASIRIGESVDITFDAYPDRHFSGKVTKINPKGVVESNVTTIHVRVEVDNKTKGFDELKPEMNANCEFIESSASNVVTVPSEAIHSENGESFVDVATGGKPTSARSGAPMPGGIPPSGASGGMPMMNKPAGATSDSTVLVDVAVERRKVTIGVVGNDTTSIESGLSDGEMVVVSKEEPKTEDDSAHKGALGTMGPPGGGKK